MQDQKLTAIEFRDIPAECQAPVRDWFAGRLAAIALDGTRSVHLPHPAGGRRRLKLKGAGYAGGPVEFGVHVATGPRAAVFDFEGRMMDDVAAGWDGAFRGGASFQQAATEYRMSRRLAGLGYAIVPCLGYGRIEKDGVSSWFALFDHEPGLMVGEDVLYPALPLDQWLHLNTTIGAVMFDLAVRHGLIGYTWYARTRDGRPLLRDLHPFRDASPTNMSQVSWVMQVFFSMHLRGNGIRYRTLKRNDPREPADLHVWQYRAFCPDVTLADHDALREELVAPYMLRPPADFSVDRLVALLRGNRITAALMAACPPEYARF